MVEMRTRSWRARPLVPGVAWVALIALVGAMALGGCSSDDDDEGEADAAATQDGGVSDAGGLGDTAGGGDDGASEDTTGQDDAGGEDAAGAAGLLTDRSLVFNADLHAVWGSGPDDVWWVGAGGLVLHYNGETLRPLDSGTDRDLFGVHGLGPDAVYIVGDGVVLFWDGTSLVERTPAEPADVKYFDVHAAKDGSTLLICGEQGIVQRRLLDKETWQLEQTNVGIGLHAIFAFGQGEVWAVGEQGQGIRLNGGLWQAITLPSASGTVFGLAATPGGDVLAVGDEGYIAVRATAWEAALSNDPASPPRALRGIAATADNEAWAIGDAGVLIRFNGAKWNVQDIDGTLMKTRDFADVWLHTGLDGAASGMAVGPGGAGLVRDGDTWQDFPARTTADLNAVAARPGGGFAAVGDGGLLMVTDSADGALVDLAAPVTAADLHGVAVAKDGTIWAVGDAGLVVQASAAGSTVVMTPAAANGVDLRGVAVLADDTVLAVGKQGAVLRYADGAWTSEDAGVDFDLEAVAAGDAGAVAVGAFGAVLSRTAAGVWSAVDAPTLETLHAVHVQSDGGVVVAGDGGVVLTGDESGLTVASQKPGLFLYGIAEDGAGGVWVVGWAGAVLRSDGEGGFVEVSSGVKNVLHGLAVDESGQALVVGKKGGVYSAGELTP